MEKFKTIVDNEIDFKTFVDEVDFFCESIDLLIENISDEIVISDNKNVKMGKYGK